MRYGKTLRQGLHFCSGSASGSVTAYLDPTETGTPPANTWGLAASSADDIFSLGGKHGLIRSLYLGASSPGNFPQLLLIERLTGNTIMTFKAPSAGGTVFNFGPGGLHIPGGFRVRLITGVDTIDFTLSYEVV